MSYVNEINNLFRNHFNDDRFSVGLRDQQEARVIGFCAGCEEEIYEDSNVCGHHDKLIHDRDSCVAKYAKKVLSLAEKEV